MWPAVIPLITVLYSEAARIAVSKAGHVTKIDDLCARMHNNTALEGVNPVDMIQANAVECQKNCVDMFPMCTAVVYYYMSAEEQHHHCYLFHHNSLHTKAILVKQNPERPKDVVRMLELASNCHKFDSSPPLEEDGLISSSDKVDRKKRQNNNTAVIGVGDWTDWSSCSKNGFESRSQACEYGRQIQRRGCPARQPLQSFADGSPSAPPPPPPVTQRFYETIDRRKQLNQSPYDEYAKRYMEMLSQQREPQRHPASQQAHPCSQGVCAPPQPYQSSPTQQIQVHNYAPSQQRPQESRYRPAPPPPPRCTGEACLARDTVQGVWYEWSEWSACSCTCGTGMKQRRRECTTNNCQGPEYENSPCDMGPCETWSEWCEWSTCGATCGRGRRSRTRFCHLGTQRCEGRDYEEDVCDAGPCPEWAHWEEWSRCSASCGTGISQRQRKCLGGDQYCPGPSTDQRTCEEHQCSLWSMWQEWSSCSVSCGNGIKRRSRTCQYGTDCQGPSEESEPCYGPSCAAWTQWCDWSGCSSQCGPGQRRRSRSCITADGLESHDCPGQNIETTLCEGTSCCQWMGWCDWSSCDRECGTGRSVRTRVCVNSEDVADGQCQCPGADSEYRECNTQPCALTCSWTTWCAWSDCSTRSQCEIGIQSRSRQCVGEPGCHCIGPTEEKQQCRGQVPCPTKVPC